MLEFSATDVAIVCDTCNVNGSPVCTLVSQMPMTQNYAVVYGIAWFAG